MIAFFIRRFIQAIIVLFIVTILVFLAMRLLPGDPIRMILTTSSAEGLTEEQIAAVRHEYGLDRPLVVQYFSWVNDILHGNLGESILQRVPVSLCRQHQGGAARKRRIR